MTLGRLLWLVARALGLCLLGVLCMLLITAHWLCDRGARGLTWLADRIVDFVAGVVDRFEGWKREARAAVRS